MSFYYIQLGCALLVFRLRNDIHNTIKSYAHLAWPGGGTCFRIGKWFWGHTRIHALQSFIGVSCLFHKYVNIYFTCIIIVLQDISKNNCTLIKVLGIY